LSLSRGQDEHPDACQADAMSAELADLTAQHAELDEVLEGLDAAGWATPSRCDGWTVSDVVLHLAQTDEMARASFEGRLAEHVESVASIWAEASDVDEGAGRMVALEREQQTPDEIYERWRDGAAALRAAYAALDPSARVLWVAGELAARSLLTTRLAECWIHTGDVAEPLGVELAPTDRLRPIARLAWRTLPYAFARAGRDAPGPVAFHLTGPNGDDWRFDPDGEPAPTVVTGPAIDLCRVAGQRAVPADTALRATGPDGDAVLELVRTFA
jgi:uncharacterized protein (TIGR03084 family)